MRWLRRWPLRRRSQRDFDEEIEAHVAFEADRLVGHGMSPRDADDAARRAFGNVTAARERFFESRRLLWLEHLRQDLRYVLRTIRRSPGFAVTALLTLAVGIGINTALFTILYSLALRPLPVRDARDVVNVYQAFAGPFTREVRGSVNMASYPEYERYRDNTSGTFQGLAAYAGRMGFSFAGAESEVIPGQVASCNYFQVLRVRMALGRALMPEDCRALNEAAVTVLGHGLWQRRFGGDSSLVGRAIVVNKTSFTVVGVAEAGFEGTDVQPAEVWFPVTMQPRLEHDRDSIVTRAQASWLTLIGRLREGVDPKRAAAELSIVARQDDASQPGRTTRIIVTPGSLANEPEMRRVGGFIALGVLAAATLVVLLICVNIMNLLLARASARRREIGVRISLGASRRRLVAQLLTESVVLSLAGGALGLGLAATVPSLLVSSTFDSAMLHLDISPDLRVFTYAFAVSCFAAVVFGLAPALRATQLDPVEALRGGAETAARGGRRHYGGRDPGAGRFRGGLVATQVAGSALLLVIAGLFVRAVVRAQQLDPGYATHGVLWLSLNLEDLGYDATRTRALHDLLRERLGSQPGVDGVADAMAIPLLARWSTQVTLPAAPGAASAIVRGAADVAVGYNIVSSNYLGLLGIPIVRGRTFTEADAAGGETPVVVSERFARILDERGSALGARFSTENVRYVVIGVARDVQNHLLAERDGPFMYQAGSPTGRGSQRLIVRHAGSPASLVRLAEEVAHAFDPALVVRAESFDDAIGRVIRPARVTALLASAFGAIAMLLALVGIYGTVSYTVSRRTREIGVRIALGARPRDVTRLVVGHGMQTVLVGLAAGALAGVGATRFLRAVLFGVNPLDPIAFGATLVIVLVAALAAVWRPAWRAARMQPTVALRVD